MKYCTYCGKEIMDEAVICPGCGCPTPKPANVPPVAPKNFCGHCGKEVPMGAAVCMNCGCPVGPQVPQNHFVQGQAVPPQRSVEGLINTLAQRQKINGIIWLVIGILQIFAGLFIEWFLLIVGVLNIVSSIQDINHSKQLLTMPKDMLSSLPAQYESLTGPIITLIYNLVIGGIIGVAGSIYYLVAVRGFVMENRSYFEAFDEKSTIEVNSQGKTTEVNLEEKYQ